MDTASLSIKVSVIIPVYNAADFIQETIQSVLDQQLKPIEIILVDDGSTDNSAELCKAYTSGNENVYYYHQENAGVSVARNKGLLMAQGAYVYFLDSDDSIDASFLSSSYEQLSHNQEDLVIIGEAYTKRFPQVMALPTCAAMWRKEFLQQHGGIQFPEGIQPCEDGLFSHQLLAMTNKIALNSAGIYHYRQHEKQNHIRSLVEVDSVLAQIPIWFDILRNFYNKHKLMPKKALHLALFLEHEPFEFRLLKMQLTLAQQESLTQLIKKFYQEQVQPYLTKEDFNRLSKPFQLFVQSSNFENFQKYYLQYLNGLRTRGKVYMLLARLIMLPKKRRKFRKQIIEKYKL
ncbi:glycosyltransferase family 2 protein [Sphingobacterium sp. HJSM2_6]|uniref:glycosyltransferase family 2 protein n=1 Tax=Sphingobacterium sp. HJSM2_6 TaxID=3366264 RepID=UPI003BE52912